MIGDGGGSSGDGGGSGGDGVGRASGDEALQSRATVQQQPLPKELEQAGHERI